MSKTVFAIAVILLISMNVYGESEEFRKKLAEAERGIAERDIRVEEIYYEGQ